MPRLLTVLLAFLLLGVGLPLSTTAAAEEAISSTASAEAVAEKPEMPPPAAEASAEEVDKGTGAAPAEEPAPAEEAEAAEEPEAPGAVDEYHRKISSGVLATSRWLDSFFADPRVENEAGEPEL